MEVALPIKTVHHLQIGREKLLGPAVVVFHDVGHIVLRLESDFAIHNLHHGSRAGYGIVSDEVTLIEYTDIVYRLALLIGSQLVDNVLQVGGNADAAVLRSSGKGKHDTRQFKTLVHPAAQLRMAVLYREQQADADNKQFLHILPQNGFVMKGKQKKTNTQ